MGDESVYLMATADGRYLKIGIARDVEARRSSLQTAHPEKLKVIGVIPGGGRRLERQLHLEFRAYRTLGEWFMASPFILERFMVG